MNDEDFFNIAASMSPNVESEIGKKAEEGLCTSFPSSAHVIEKKIHSILTVRIYPDGQMFISRSQSWIDKKDEIVKKKEEKKQLETTKAEVTAEEVY